PGSGRPQPIKVLIVDDRRTFGEALQLALGREEDLEVVEVLTDGPSAVRAVSELNEDEMLLARAVQAGAAGLLRKTEAVLDVGAAVRQAHRGEPIHDEREIEGALRRLRHRRDQDASAEGRLARLTPREVEILQLMATGRPADRIARDLGVSPHTLRTHMQNIITKLG